MPYKYPEGRWASLHQRGKNGEDALQRPVGQGGEKWTNDVGKAMCTTDICKAGGTPYVRQVRLPMSEVNGEVGNRKWGLDSRGGGGVEKGFAFDGPNPSPRPVECEALFHSAASPGI